MKPDKTSDDQFRWDMTVVVLIVLAAMFLILLIIGIGPVKHIR